MSIDSFILEIENRKKNEIEVLDKELEDKKVAIESKKSSTVKELQERYANEAKIRFERETARIIEGGKLDAKKILFDAININLDSTFGVIKQELSDYTKNSGYKKVLQKMVEASKKKLDEEIIIHCRKEDNSILNELDATVGSSIHTLGGIVAENKIGTKELDLTFEELLRTHEDEIKNTILEKIL
jgi:vacuolar-type H+-ATPase subunit E/Vma4